MQSKKNFEKWDIVWASRFPETIQCQKCAKQISAPTHIVCPHTPCTNKEPFTQLVVKVRPVILWKSQRSWYRSLTFGIPLSTTDPGISDKWNSFVRIEDCSFARQSEAMPRRALIAHATRLEGNTFNMSKFIGSVRDLVKRDEIENKLIEWLFEAVDPLTNAVVLATK